MGCCFSCGSSSNEISKSSKETVYKFDNEAFDKPSSNKVPISKVSDIAKEYKKKELVVPNISVTPASPEIIETGLENKAYNPSGDLRLDDYEEYPNYEPLRRMSADIREQKQKEEEKARREKEAQDMKIKSEESEVINDTKVQSDDCNKEKGENRSKDSLQASTKESRKRDDSEASFTTVYHTATEPSHENANIDKEGVDSKTTVTVEVHSSSSNSSSSELPQASTIELPEDASRKFSQLAPAPKDGPLSQQMGQFSVTPTEGQASSASPTSVNPATQSGQFSSLGQDSLISVVDESTSRKFSQLAPAPSNSPHAVQVGEKFTMIPTEAKH